MEFSIKKFIYSLRTICKSCFFEKFTLDWYQYVEVKKTKKPV